MHGTFFSSYLAIVTWLRPPSTVNTLRSIGLFVLAAVFEVGGAWLVWQGVKEHRGWSWIASGIVSLGIYGFVATLQPNAQFGRILAAYAGVFVAGSLAWGVVADGFRPTKFDYIGAGICLIGVEWLPDRWMARLDTLYPQDLLHSVRSERGHNGDGDRSGRATQLLVLRHTPTKINRWCAWARIRRSPSACTVLAF
jgi:small multidrug resistance family-3 protein